MHEFPVTRSKLIYFRLSVASSYWIPIIGFCISYDKNNKTQETGKRRVALIRTYSNKYPTREKMPKLHPKERSRNFGWKTIKSNSMDYLQGNTDAENDW